MNFKYSRATKAVFQNSGGAGGGGGGGSYNTEKCFLNLSMESTVFTFELF